MTIHTTALSRRRLLQSGGLAAASWLAIGPRSLRAAANDRLRLAGIGVGGMGGSDLASLSSHGSVEVVGLCDVDTGNLAAAGEKHPGAARFADFREMFEKLGDSIDAVHVSTPDHTHAAAAMTAMNLGKHVYCQKPLTHDVYESRQLRLVAAKTGLVTQMGTQIHSTTPYRTAVNLVQSGVIGPVSEVHSWSNKTWGYDGPDPATGEPPASLAWNLWLGTAAERPFCPGQYHPGNWRRWYDFGCGTMGDMAIHILDPVFSALTLGAPSEIVSASSTPPPRSYGMQNETRFTFAQKTAFTTDDFRLTWYDGGRMPDTSAWPLDTAEGKRMDLPGQGSMFVGSEGAILLPHVGMPVLLPAAQFAETEIVPAENGNHYHLFVDACLGGAPTTCGFDYAGPLTEAVLLGTIANRFPGDTLRWEPETMQLPGHDAAQALLRRQYREGFEVSNL
jgi:predicted dehydrogenase